MVLCGASLLTQLPSWKQCVLQHYSTVAWHKAKWPMILGQWSQICSSHSLSRVAMTSSFNRFGFLNHEDARSVGQTWRWRVPAFVKEVWHQLLLSAVMLQCPSLTGLSTGSHQCNRGCRRVWQSASSPINFSEQLQPKTTDECRPPAAFTSDPPPTRESISFQICVVQKFLIYR